MSDRGIIVSVIGVVAALLVGVVVLAIHDSRRWDRYQHEHGCALTGNTDTFTYYTTIYVGDVPVITPHTGTRREWVCRDDERVWR